jgi:hypothetical protein
MGVQHLSSVAFSTLVIPVAKTAGLAVIALLSMLALGFRLRRTMVVPPAVLGESQPELRKLRQAAEDEVISEFLKNEFHHPDFDGVRKEFAAVVLTPNLQDAAENARRRQLLFRKRGGLWRELPSDTVWWLAEISPRALGRVRVFPRADWRRYSQRGFSLPQFAGSIVAGLAQTPLDPFLRALSVLQQQLAKDGPAGSVLLIGIDEDKPLTILEGNHRLVAAALKGSPSLRNFRFYCGFSPRMSHCCWYRSSVANFLHYAGNLLRDMSQFRHSDVAKLLSNRRLAAKAAMAATAESAIQLSGAGLQVTQDELTTPEENLNA